MTVYVCKLCLKNTGLHCTHGCATSLCLLALPKESLGYTVLMVHHLKGSLCLLALPKESLGYTVLMGAPPKVQPMFVSST